MYLFVPCDKKSHGTEISFPIRSSRLSHPQRIFSGKFSSSFSKVLQSITSAGQLGPAYNAVADPGFPRGNQPLKERNLIFRQFSRKLHEN